MVINIIVCIAAVILLLRGAFLVLQIGLLWIVHCKMINAYSKKTFGKVVDIEIRAKSDGMNIIDVCIPKIKYKLEGEQEVCCQFIPFDPKSEEESHIYLYPKLYHIGDKVVILYDEKKKDDMLVLPNMQTVRLFISRFVLGSFFIISAILGLYFVF